MLHAGWTCSRARPFLLTLPHGALSGTTRTFTSTVVVAGLKKKHKSTARKPAAKEAEAAAEELPQKPAPRIDTNQFGIKTWKRIIKQHKVQAVPAAPKLAQSFRKPKLEDEERLAREREREKAYLAARKKTSTSASFASLYGTKGDTKPPVLLVDGYNVLGRLAGITSDDEDEQEARVSAAFSDGPRQVLQNRLCEYSHLRQVKVILVFDALGGGSGTVQRTTAKGAIDVVYCGDSDADTFIMLEVAVWKQKGTPQVLVATSDRELGDSIAGAHIVSSAALVREIVRAEKEATARMRASQLTPWTERPGIGANVLSKDPGLYQKLQDMRAGRF